MPLELRGNVCYQFSTLVGLYIDELRTEILKGGLA